MKPLLVEESIQQNTKARRYKFDTGNTLCDCECTLFVGDMKWTLIFVENKILTLDVTASYTLKGTDREHEMFPQAKFCLCR